MTNFSDTSMRPPRSRLLILPLLVSLSLGGCATTEYVHKEVGQYDQRIVALESWFNTLTTGLDTQAKRLLEVEARMDRMEQGGSSMGARLDATEAALRDSGRRMDGLAADLGDANLRIEAGKLDATRTAQRVGALDSRVDGTRLRLDGVVSGLAAAEGRIGALEGGFSKVSSSIEAQRAAEAAGRETPPITPSALSTQPISMPALAAPGNSAPSVVPDSATNPLLATQPSQQPPSDEGIDATRSLLAEISQKIESQNGALSVTNSRLAALESDLAAASRRSQAQEETLRSTDQKVGALRTELALVRQKAYANTEAITLVDNRVGEVNAGLEEAHKRVEEGEKVLAESGLRLTMVQDLVKGQSERLSRTEQENDKASSTALEALERASEAGKLAEGKLVFETVLSDEITSFGFKEAKLNDSAKQQLNDFANKLKAENKGVYIEIQGHTDSFGSAAVNLRLSRERAQAVRDYLNQEAGIPLHRLAVAAYGESKPVADNNTREGRSRNRRVVLVVLE